MTQLACARGQSTILHFGEVFLGERVTAVCPRAILKTTTTTNKNNNNKQQQQQHKKCLNTEEHSTNSAHFMRDFEEVVRLPIGQSDDIIGGPPRGQHNLRNPFQLQSINKNIAMTL